MLPEYLQYWGFERQPFSLSPDPEMLFLSSQHREGIMRLKYGVVSNKGGVLLISENAGDGKTSILRKLIQELTDEYESKIRIAFIDHPTLTVNQMIAEIARQFGVSRVRKEKIDNLNALRGKLTELHEADIKSLVIIDEGQMLVHRPEMLQELRILLNFCVADTFLLSFIFSGQKPLEGAVKKMPEFWQRLPVRFFLRNLDLRDTGELLRFRVRVAGVANRDIFSPTAVEGIYRFSQGCPRVICSIADLALLVGHSMRSQKIDFSEVSQATTDMTKTGELFHYFSFMESKSKKRNRQCPSCKAFVKVKDSACSRCGSTLDGSAAEPEREEKVQCPSCLQLGSAALRCSFCGFLLAQTCPRCQRTNDADAAGCAICGYPLAGRHTLATRTLEDGLRKLKVQPVSSGMTKRFPMLEGEGRVFVGWAAPRFWWGETAELEAGGRRLAGSFFLAERAIVFVNGSDNRRIAYPEIRNVSITVAGRDGSISRPRLSLVLDSEELALTFPVKTDNPIQLSSLISDFITNKRLG
ncbi:MAG: AAA family ATPase [Acidobacteriota bacterium]